MLCAEQSNPPFPWENVITGLTLRTPGYKTLRPISNKTTLIQWLNNCTLHEAYRLTKIEQLDHLLHTEKMHRRTWRHIALKDEEEWMNER